MFTLNAEQRSQDLSPKKLRKQGIIPCTIYGKSIESTNLQIDHKQVQKCLKSGSLKVDLEWGKNKFHATIDEVQFNAVGTEVLHVSFHAFADNEKITMDIPVHLNGKAKGQMDGGVIKLQTDHITVYGSPAQVPESFELNIGDLELGSSWHISDLKENYPFEIKTPEDTVLVACHYPKLEVVEEPEVEEVEALEASAEETPQEESQDQEKTAA
jgi:large subunit ribosomal protein L25